MSQENNKACNHTDGQNDKYVPPKVWTQDKENGGKFASINLNRPDYIGE